MTWGALLRALLADPLAWLLALSVGTLCAIGGYFYGLDTEHAANELRNKAAIVELYEEVRPIEKAVAKITSEAAKEHEQTKQSNNATVRNVDYVGLRYRSPCPDLPPVAGSAGESKPSSPSERHKPNESDFEDIARKLTELGADYDNAVSQIAALLKVIESYRTASFPE